MEDAFISRGGSTPKSQPEAPILAQGHGWVVLNKPAGLPSHPGRNRGASAEDFFPQLSRRPQLPHRKHGPWLAHRLDTDTAGCLLIALRKSILIAAQAAFATGQAKKVYWAITAGEIPAEQGVIDAPLAKITTPSGWRMATLPRGDRAITNWRVLGRAPGLTWLELRPATGRTHQLRVHCAHLGAPILGDPVYGPNPGALHLLARSLDLPFDPPISAIAPPPQHMEAALRACGWPT